MNKLHHLFLMFSHFDTGGLQTAMVRMSQWCQSSGIDCLIIFDSYDDKMLAMCKGLNLDYLHSYDGARIAKAIKKRMESDGDRATVITFELPEFLYFEAIRRRWLGRINLQHFIYNVSVGGMLYGREIKGAAGRVVRALNRLLVDAMQKSNQAFYMDTETRDAPFNYFGMNIQEDETHIIPLPMFVSKRPAPHRFERGRIIMTVARAQFPYKGYLLGLVEDYPELKSKYPDMRLRIITFGPDKSRLEQVISSCPEHARSSIELIGHSTTAEIRKYLQDAWLYIGMGTTVLDAADEGVPSIVSCHSTEENRCAGFFNDNPTEIGRAAEGVPGNELIEEIASLSLDEYEELSAKTFEAYRRTYDIESIMPRILGIREANKDGHVALLYAIGYFVFYKARNLRRNAVSIISRVRQS